jgi:hypothetical protein
VTRIRSFAAALATRVPHALSACRVRPGSAERVSGASNLAPWAFLHSALPLDWAKFGANVRLRQLATPSFALVVLAAGCEPQDIYMFDPPPVLARADAGASEPEPEGSDDDSGPDDSSDPEDLADREDAGGLASEQPDCRSQACNTCVEDAACAGDGAVSWCHPTSGTCAQACDPAAAISQVGSCPAPQRCDPELGLCVACITNDDCGGLSSVCDEGRCVQCLTDADCSGREDERRCLGEQRLCVECRDSSDCTDPQRGICSGEYECEDED